MENAITSNIETVVNNIQVQPNVAPVKDAQDLVSMQLEKLGETMGDYKPYDSQLPIAEIEGTRIVKCLYQKSSKQASSYVRIPCKHLTEELLAARMSELTPYLLNYLQEVESQMIKDEHKQGLLSCYVDALSLDKIIEKLEASEAGARLNKEKIEAWFASDLAESLTVRFAEKLGISENPSEEQLAKLEMILAAYKKKFSSLASGKTFIKEEDCTNMISVIEFCEADKSLIGSRFIARLGKMQKKEEDLLLAL